ncbi:hypothetical protein HFTV1-gp55 [Haloferax tailed virus 1]|uniref:Uncharacterized protein n=1 Tax=Haloferax tailed virus 1 TaxID=2507575 RepID=A0A410N6W1_HFTV1|nr:hypothetical protein M1M17_gp55 [Haloferax tailed virus 1]QAS68888.1 hypothetical protein HFTV1-gp55 [Haloferax tailed virus 1]
MTDKEDVRFNVIMPQTLRDDAKKNAERGELSEEVRDLFRRKAYGIGSSEQPSEIDETKAELREVRAQIDDLRHKRSQIDAKIQTKETRAARLEERISELQDQRDEVQQSLDVLENMLQNGERMWPKRIENAADVDEGTSHELYQELQTRNSELPKAAFEQPTVKTPADWREEQRQ